MLGTPVRPTDHVYGREGARVRPPLCWVLGRCRVWVRASEDIGVAEVRGTVLLGRRPRDGRAVPKRHPPGVDGRAVPRVPGIVPDRRTVSPGRDGVNDARNAGDRK